MRSRRYQYTHRKGPRTLDAGIDEVVVADVGETTVVPVGVDRVHPQPVAIDVDDVPDVHKLGFSRPCQGTENAGFPIRRFVQAGAIRDRAIGTVESVGKQDVFRMQRPGGEGQSGQRGAGEMWDDD